MVQEEGSMLFASGVGSLNGEGWQAETYEKNKVNRLFQLVAKIPYMVTKYLITNQPRICSGQ